MKKYFVFLLTVLCTMSAQAVDDYTLDLSKIQLGWAGGGGSFNAETGALTVVQYEQSGWTFAPAVSTSEYSGVVIECSSPSNISLQIEYDGAETQTTAIDGAGTINFSQSAPVMSIKFAGAEGGSSITLTSVKLKGIESATPTASGNFTLTFDNISAGWGLTKDSDAKTITISEYAAAGWSFYGPVSTSIYSGVQLNVSSTTENSPAVTIKYANGQEQKIDVTSTVVSQIVSFTETGLINSIEFAGNNTYTIGQCLLVGANVANTEFSVAIASTTNGTVTADKTTAKPFEEVTLTITPADGYELDEVTAYYAIKGQTADSDGGGWAAARRSAPTVGAYAYISINEDGKFTMPAGNVTVTATFKERGAEPAKPKLTVKKQWVTFCSPATFAVPDGLKAYTVTAVTEPADGETGVITATEENYVKAGIPMLIENTNLETTEFEVDVTETDVTLSGTPTAEYKGVTSATTINANTYVLVDGTFLLTDGGVLPAYNCFFEFSSSSPAPARRYSIAIGENTTAIESIGSATLNEGQWYDLQGRRVDQPKRGIYVKNGKKVVVK